jgi:hypothetical protein
MSANVNDVTKWIEELKKREISEFRFRDLPDDLKKMGMLRRASVLKKIKELNKIKEIITWKVE